MKSDVVVYPPDNYQWYDDIATSLDGRRLLVPEWAQYARRALVMLDREGQESAERWYDPNSVVPTLFLQLANSEPNRAGLECFVGTFGPLHMGMCDTATVESASGPLHAFTLYEWRLWLAQLRTCLGCHAALAANDPTRFGSEEPAENWRQQMEQTLAHTVGFQLIGLSFGLTRDACSWIPEPEWLIQFVWLQFQQAHARGAQLTTCDSCGRWFERNRVGRSRGQRYCNNACRQRAHRARVAAR